MPDEAAFSRSSEPPLFGKRDVPLTVNVSSATEAQLKAHAAQSGCNGVSEYINAIIECSVWGTAEVMARASARKLPVGILRITGQ